MSTAYLTFLSLTAMSMALLAWGLRGIWQQMFDPRYKALARRLATSDPARLQSLSLSLRPRRQLSQWAWAENILQTLPGISRLDIFLLQTGLKLSVGQIMAGVMALVVGSLLVGLMLNWPAWLVWFCSPAVLALLWTFLNHHRTQRMDHIGNALPNALDLIARSMQAGHAFISALQIAAKDSPAPLSTELRAVFDEINFGVSSSQALQSLSNRVASEDIRYFVVAVIIQSETGGNLAEVLKNTAMLIRKRQNIAGLVRVLSAEGRISAVILSVMPFALAALMSLLSPGFISKLWTDPIGLKMVYTSLCLMLLGILWMWKLIKIRV